MDLVEALCALEHRHLSSLHFVRQNEFITKLAAGLLPFPGELLVEGLRPLTLRLVHIHVVGADFGVYFLQVRRLELGMLIRDLHVGVFLIDHEPPNSRLVKISCIDYY